MRTFAHALLGIAGLLWLAGLNPASAETINSALAAAYQDNPTLNAQRAATRVTDEGVPIAKSGWRPQVFATADVGILETESTGGAFPSSNSLKPRGFGVSISQNLWDSFKTLNNVNAARAAVRAAQEALRNTEQNVLFNAAASYLDVQRDAAIIGYRGQALEFLNEQVRSETSRFDVGESTRTDVAQAKARQSGAVAALSLARATLKSSAAVYRQNIGREPNNLKPVKGVARLMPKSLTSAMATAEREHPAIKSTEHLVDQAIFNVKSAESDLLPTVTLDGSASKAIERSTPNTRTDSASISATLTVPIYQGGSASGLVRQGKETLGQRRIEVDVSVDNVRAAVVSAYSQYEAAIATTRANEEQLSAANLALSGAVEERKVGQRTTLDVLDTQQTVINAQIDLINSRRDLKVAGYAVLSAIGRLNASRIGLDVAVYDPSDHLNVVKDKWYGLRIPSGN